MSLNKNKLLQRILKHIEAQHCGSGEVELEDAVDPCTLLTKNYQHGHEHLTAKLKLVETQLEALDPSWSNWQLPTSMIVVPADGSESALLLSIYQLGYTEECSLKGKSKSVHILDTVENFLDNPYSSERSPIGCETSTGANHTHKCIILCGALDRLLQKLGMQTHRLGSG